MAEATDSIDGKEDCEEIIEKEDEILELAIHYVQNGSYPPAYSIGSQSLHLRLAAILRTQERQFHIRFVDVQRQSGGSDCGCLLLPMQQPFVVG